MGRKKSQNTDIELGVVEEKEWTDGGITESYPDFDDDIAIEDEAVIDEDIPLEETGGITNAVVTFVGKDSIWFDINGLGFEMKTARAHQFKKGDKISIIHTGFVGKPGFEIKGIAV